jgi:hypothetical protein
MALGVVFTAGLMLTLYLFDWTFIAGMKSSDDPSGRAMNEKF